MATTQKLVRLRPYDPRRRQVLKSYMHGPSGQRFEEKRGWYRVTEAIARYLSKVRQIETDPESPLAFDVCTFEEAKAIDAREKKVVVRRASAAEANDLTTDDLPNETRRRAEDLADASEKPKPAAPKRAAAMAVPRAQQRIRRGVRDPRERSMRPVAEDETA